MRLNVTCYSCFVINNADQKDFSFVLCASALNTKVHTSASNVDPDETIDNEASHQALHGLLFYSCSS